MLTRPQSSSRNAQREQGGKGRGKGSFPPSHYTPRATKERQRERRLGTSQAKSECFRNKQGNNGTERETPCLTLGISSKLFLDQLISGEIHKLNFYLVEFNSRH